MNNHTSRTFLTSCLKVPIDPCNNCPAPVYNRPKLYLRGLNTTSSSVSKITTTNTLKANEFETESETVWSCSGIRSLAKLYDSIPDYCEINHLPEDEFYSTLDTLRTTCQELRIRTRSATSGGIEHRRNSISSTPSTVSSQSKSKKKPVKKKSSRSRKQVNDSCQSNRERERIINKMKADSPKLVKENMELSWITPDSPCNVMGYKKVTLSRSKNINRSHGFRDECEDEVAAFHRSLKEFETELIRSSSPEPPPPPPTQMEHINIEKQSEKMRIMNAAREKVPARGRCLKKSFSYNDLNFLSTPTSSPAPSRNPVMNTIGTISKAESMAFRDAGRLSNYFPPEKVETPHESLSPPLVASIPKILIQTPISRMSSAQSTASAVHKTKGVNNAPAPFTIFNLSSTISRKEKSQLKTTITNPHPHSPSPKHPVARPNLAATLRAEVSRKKRKELQSNCTYNDPTPPVDWEVRKTPAWKSLGLNETHKQILAMRLATRKVEQELQKKEYDLNMELMRQRVKSAPLLLEGTTYWGPVVGRLTHTCPSEGVKHSCQNSVRRRRKKQSQSQSPSTGRRAISECSARHLNDDVADIRMNKKLQNLKKIYSSKTPQTLSAHQTHRSETSARSEKSGKRVVHRTRMQQNINSRGQGGNESGDDLCSIDRAYL